MAERFFVWHKCGPESGSSLIKNVEIKECQRRASRMRTGIFLWGVGSSIGSEALKALLEHEESPEVLFTPIVSKGRAVDRKYLNCEEKNLTEWRRPLIRRIEGLNIEEYSIDISCSDAPWHIPDGCQVVSYENEKKHHFALVCQSSEPLVVHAEGVIPLRLVKSATLYRGVRLLARRRSLSCDVILARSQKVEIMTLSCVLDWCIHILSNSQILFN